MSWQAKTCGRRGLVSEGTWTHSDIPLVHIPRDLFDLHLLKIEQEPGNRWCLSLTLEVEILA